MIAKAIQYLNEKQNKKEYAFMETYGLNKGLKHFGKKGYDAAISEVEQLHDRNAFKPVHIGDMTKSEREKALESLIFLAEKKDGRVKA
jgi:hypothetical protein